MGADWGNEPLAIPYRTAPMVMEGIAPYVSWGIDASEQRIVVD